LGDVLITCRPVDPNRDFPGIVALVNAIDPESITVNEYARTYHRSTPEQRAYRAVAIDTHTQEHVRGYAVAIHRDGMPPGHVILWLGVNPQWREQGIGSSLYDHMVSFLKTSGWEVTSLESDVSDACPNCLAFAEHRGFHIERHLFESTLDLAQFNASAFQEILESVEAQGIRFLSFAELPRSADVQQRLYDLDQRIALDMPGGNWFPLTFETFQQQLFDDLSCEPQGKIIAVDGEEWIGLAIVLLYRESNAAYNFMTGVDRRYRGRKIGLALKLLTIQYAKERGLAYLRTNNDSENTAILALNQKLGYRSEPGRYLLRFSS
jgi:ribosomal protein S18 acetylase RimI-like enzyme